VLTLGWIGGTQNYFLLDKLMPVLNELAQVFCFKLLVIGGESYKRDTKFDIEFVPWALNSEIENLKKIDIGLMPLNNDTRSKGKCGFKLIQYMGLGITSIASSITVNREIVDDEIDSFLVSSEDSWYIILNKILNEQVNLQGMGNNARKKINKNYTFKSNVNSYIAFLNL
jgi:glycosyltransferase involved in cell wall biosynthesis